MNAFCVIEIQELFFMMKKKSGQEVGSEIEQMCIQFTTHFCKYNKNVSSILIYIG